MNKSNWHLNQNNLYRSPLTKQSSAHPLDENDIPLTPTNEWWKRIYKSVLHSVLHFINLIKELFYKSEPSRETPIVGKEKKDTYTKWRILSWLSLEKSNAYQKGLRVFLFRLFLLVTFRACSKSDNHSLAFRARVYFWFLMSLMFSDVAVENKPDTFELQGWLMLIFGSRCWAPRQTQLSTSLHLQPQLTKQWVVTDDTFKINIFFTHPPKPKEVQGGGMRNLTH